MTPFLVRWGVPIRFPNVGGLGDFSTPLTSFVSDEMTSEGIVLLVKNL